MEFRENSKKSTSREVQFGQMLNEMMDSLRRLEDHSEKRIISVLNDEEIAKSELIYHQLIKSLWSRRWVPVEKEQAKTDMLGDTGAASFRNAIIASLRFEHADIREEAIPQAFENTFSWIYRTEIDPQRSSFTTWLESNKVEPYWITGKPGSGKSTLMKFIQSRPELKAHLTKWAGSLPLCISNYYAWSPGSNLQKSTEGLIRTILYQCLSRDENKGLLPLVARRRWTLLNTLLQSRKMPEWEEWELLESLGALCEGVSETTRLVLFVDGLDEFAEPPLRIVELIQSISSRKGIKVCVASRQWSEFNDAFDQHPMLRMQDLTYQDITCYVGAKFNNSRGFTELKEIFPVEASALLSDIVKKAQGVFLWLSLVVKDLLECLTEGDGLPEMREVLDALPSDIDQLYSAIWASIKHRKVSGSAQLMALLRAAARPLDYLTLWLADGGHAQGLDLPSMTREAKSNIAKSVVRRLDSRTRGILEMASSGTVDFHHRTAMDWAAKAEVVSDIFSSLPTTFDPYFLLMQAEAVRVTELRSCTRDEASDAMRDLALRVLNYAIRVESSPTNNPRATQILDTFDKAMETICQHLVRKACWQWCVGIVQNPACPWLSKSDSFLEVAAKLCLVPYLNGKLATGSGNCAISDKNAGYLLEQTILGHERKDFFCTSLASEVPLIRRQDTVRWMLRSGASARQLSPDIREYIEWRAASPVGEDDLYWREVAKLLSENRSVRNRLKYRLRSVLSTSDTNKRPIGR